MTTVTFPAVDAPLVSIVVVTYGGFDWVVDALQAVVDHTDACYEVIVVDNASPDGTGPRLRDAVHGATVVLNEVNVGFGAGANQGALLAVGRHLFFLNSDAFVQAGWLPPLLAAVDDPGVAAAASCLVEPDGTLQEAGGIVGANGYAGQLGMGADARLPEYRFRRRVDFASGAAILVRRRDFLAVGGFHPAFVMGYFEDVDLCLDLARHGLATMYEPASVVTHLRGASTGPGVAVARATANHPVFVARWSDELDRRPTIAEVDAYPHRVAAARDFVACERILVVAGCAPDAPLRGFLGNLARLWPGARVTALVPRPAGSIEDLVALGVEVVVGQDDPEAWSTSRRFHYSVVVLDGAVDDAVGEMQPQAARVQLARFTDGPVDVEMARVRTADVVVCLSERAQGLVAAWAGTSRVVVPPDDVGALIDAMAGIGVAPPVTAA